jgi:hypothetical protein
MSLAIAIPSPGWAWQFDYEPVTQPTYQVQRALTDKRNYLQGSASDWLPILEAALLNIKKECRDVDWDGIGAIPVRGETIKLTAQIGEVLYAMMPRGTPVPDVIPEADGEICISWSLNSDRIFSLSVGPNAKINFSGQFGKEGAVHAWQPIDPTSRSSLQGSLEDVARYIARLLAASAERGRP